MDDLISRQAAIDSLRFCELGMETETIANIPSIDAVPVVRCKDCEWYEEENHNCLVEMGFARIWKPTDYCSFGERKDDE